jgi:poly-beta-1,6-N-acetyl-D-glucosamine synthase
MIVLFWTCLAVIFYIYWGYPIMIGLLAWFRPRLEISDIDDGELPHVSLIIAAYNEQLTIKRKIDNVFNLDYPPEKLELIIGSDGSDDKTNEIIEGYISERIHFYPHQKRRGKMAVVNDGVAQATGEICVFTDVSEVFDRDAVKKLVRNFQDPSVGAVTGNHVYNPSSDGLARGVGLYWNYQRWLQRMESRVESIMSCDGTIYACRRELFEAPPTGIINDDKAVPWKLIEKGKRVIFEPTAIARGEVLSDTGSFFRQKIRGQAGMHQLFFMYKKFFLPKRPMLWFIFMSHTVGPVLAPWLVLLILVFNILLVGQMPYTVFFWIQIIFYGGAVIEMAAQRLKFHVPALHVPYIFTVSNIASLCAFWAFLFKTQKATWKKVE